MQTNSPDSNVEVDVRRTRAVGLPRLRWNDFVRPRTSRCRPSRSVAIIPVTTATAGRAAVRSAKSLATPSTPITMSTAKISSVRRNFCARTMRKPSPSLAATSSATTMRFQAAARFTRAASMMPGQRCAGRSPCGTRQVPGAQREGDTDQLGRHLPDDVRDHQRVEEHGADDDERDLRLLVEARAR